MSEIIDDRITHYLNSLRGEVDPLMAEMESFAKERKIPILEWQTADFIEQLILINKPKKVLEVGTAIGYTTIRIAKMLQPGASIETIELSKDNIPLARENFIKAGLEEKIALHEGNALSIIPDLSKDYDIIFLDADKEDYMEYYNQLADKLRVGGILLIDNLLWHGYVVEQEVKENYKASTRVVMELNKIILRDERFKSTILTIGDGLGMCIKL
ncbi:MAG: O-methyltransferase [Bacteroidetes bacterium]|nr:O-methyltransferase [Bacteroidota bacterium]